MRARSLKRLAPLLLAALAQSACTSAREQQLPGLDHVFLFPPVPMAVQRVANIERAQMLIEAASRPALQRLLDDHAAQREARRVAAARLIAELLLDCAACRRSVARRAW